jgi:hypothetical protein
MRLCNQRRSHLDRAKSREVHSDLVRRLDAAGVCLGSPAMMPDCKAKRERTVLGKLLGAVAMAATAYAFVPAHAAHVHHAAHVGVGCSGDNFAKAEGDVETMADGPRKFLAEREIAEAQDAMLGGKLSGCAMHLSQARQAESMSQAPYPGTMFSAPAVQPPAETTQETPSQPQGNWQP